MDSHHKKLFDLVNELASAMLGGMGSDLLKPTFKSLIRYTKEHFAAEERLFTATDYPHAQDHLRAHQDLIREIDVLWDRFDSGEHGMSVHTLDFLKQWIEKHILETDSKYRAYLS